MNKSFDSFYIFKSFPRRIFDVELFKSAVILCGGKSSRMGFDKQLLTIDKTRLIEKVIARLRKEFEEIIIVTNKPEYYEPFQVKLVSDKYLGMGPLAGIHAALIEAQSEFVYFIACDMPNINLEYIKHMKSRLVNSDAQACVTRIGQWIEPLNSFFSKKALGQIEEDLLSKKGSVYYLLKKIKCLYIDEKDAREHSPDWSMFLNLNTREELDDFLKNIIF